MALTSQRGANSTASAKRQSLQYASTIAGRQVTDDNESDAICLGAAHYLEKEKLLDAKFAENVRTELERLGKAVHGYPGKVASASAWSAIISLAEWNLHFPKRSRFSSVLHVPLSQLAGEDLFQVKTLVSMVRRIPAAEQELIKVFPSGLLLKEMEQRLKK